MDIHLSKRAKMFHLSIHYTRTVDTVLGIEKQELSGKNKIKKRFG
jgi:hypothetical protein